MATINLNDTQYAYVDEGSGPLVVFGHGLLASREMFRAQIDALKDRYRCISLDWPGHGESEWRDEGWTFWDLADDAALLVRMLGEQQAVFAGLSQGGFAFMRLAMSHPTLVRGLILLDTSAGPEEPDAIDGYRELDAALHKGNKKVRRGAAETVATIRYGPAWREANPDGLEHEIEIMLAHPKEGLHRAANAVFDREDVTGMLGEISAPTLVICGEQDSATRPERSRTLAAEIPDTELAMIPNAGHHSAIENPDAVTAAIERFLARI